MRNLTALLAGIVTAVLAAGVWMAISILANYELGIIAWAVGAAVGFAVFAGSGRVGGVGLGLLAVVLALGGIVLGKYGAAFFAVQDLFDEEEIAISAIADEIIHKQEIENGNSGQFSNMYNPDEDAYSPAVWSQAENQFRQMSADERERLMQVPMLANEQYHLTYIADRLVEERLDAGQQIDWPTMVEYEDAFYEEHYPKDIWTDAVARWNAMSESEQNEYRQHIYDEHVAERKQYESTFKLSLVNMVFKSSFNGFDILWGVLAVFSAFKLGSAGSQSKHASTA